MRKSLLLLLAMLLSISIFVVACGGDTDEPAESDADAGEEGTDEEGSDEETAEGDVPQGGTVTYGYTQAFEGIFDIAHYGGANDGVLLNLITEGLITYDEELMPQPHLADWEIDEEGTTITFNIQEGVYWHNGEELTSEDMAFAWEVIADPDYTGTRYSNVNMIVGADEYRAGEADEIEGINIVDDHTLEVTVVEPRPNTLLNLWTNPIPKAHYDGIAVADLEDADEVRRNPIGVGPYKVENIVPGEQVELVANEDYWQGAPNLDSVVYKVVDGAMAAELMMQGEIDIVQLPPSQAIQVEGDESVVLEDVEALSYSYIGFKLGQWDGEQVQMDNPKFADKNVRKAFAHAIDRQTIIDSFSEGYGQVINAPESVISWAYPDEADLVDYNYDPELAEQLLEEAGYVDTNDDGWREDPDGEEFTVNFMAMSGTDIAEPRAEFIVRNLQEVGINASLQDGRLYEMNLFYDLVEEDDADIDLFMGAWGLSPDPDPTGLWKQDDFWNFSRWSNDESEELIERGLSEEAMDIDYRTEVYSEWHQLVNEELPIIPMFSPTDIYAINSEVGGVSPFMRDATRDSHLWYREQ
ncbi:oligopeptide ABC transporter substrate-binding protein [Alteribacter aurantiacus]|uniref:oligopeptide ABC transporter substrate-binding protein n=1 Tax=Alteribacter aurantiacus TaxID=254410 RepID=UPI0003FB3182|nr:oligopeptide ABC transporter substrate-binding protein [Alteribacter aurantiacus]